MASYTPTGITTNLDMYDVKTKQLLPNLSVELVELSNGRYAVRGTNPETGMTLFKLVKKSFAQQLKGEIIV